MALGTSSDIIGRGVGLLMTGPPVAPLAANWACVAANTLEVTISHFFSLVLAATRGLKLPSLSAGFERSGRTSVVLVSTKPLS